MKDFNNFVETNSKKLYDIQNDIFKSQFDGKVGMSISDVAGLMLNVSGMTMIEFLRVYHEWSNE